MQNFFFQIHGNNEAKRIAFEQAAIVIPQLQDFVGKKIFLANGGKAKSFTVKPDQDIKVKPFQSFKGRLHWCRVDELHGDLYLLVKIYIHDSEHGVRYFEYNISVGNIENGVLQKVHTEHLRDGFTPVNGDDELVKIKAYLQAQRIADKLKDQIRVREETYTYLNLLPEED